MATPPGRKSRRAQRSFEDDAKALLLEMIPIPGRSGEEGDVLALVRQKLLEAGLPEAALQTDSAHRRSPRGGQTGNLIVKLPGTRRGPRRLLMAHLDTVPLCVGVRPVQKGQFLRPQDRTTALGGDNRAGASVVLHTACEIVRKQLPHPPVTFLWTVQEEVGLLGARHVSLSKLGRPQLCFNWDGGDPNLLIVGATGDYNIEIEVEGIASHAGAHPEDGVSAIAIASLAIARLVQDGWHGLIEKGDDVGTANVGVIEGGEATNVVTPSVRVRAEARSHDPKFRKRIVAEIRKAFVEAARQVKNSQGRTGRVRFQADLKYESFRLSTAEPCVQAATAAIETLGLEPELRICNGGLDANWMTAHGLPTVTLGCGQQGIHTVKEKLHIPSYLTACRIALRLATGTEREAMP
ncbi:MAG: M20/M25/M40 family metallo-hydrolase [Planctomycetes bacterium]|nr:M20/M25/M40 family metallo-hydrolase [Planctomycetota bacterium]